MNPDIFLLVPPTRSFTQRMPFGLMYISSYLTSKGKPNRLIDYKGMDSQKAFEKIKAVLISAKPKYIGITCMVSDVEIVKEMCDFIRKNLDSLIIIGGPHPSISPNDFIKLNIAFDFLVLGEGEFTFFELIDFLQNNRCIESVPGIAYLRNKKLKINAPRELMENLDDLPLPAYDQVNMAYYSRPNVWAMRPIYISSFTIFTTRGCPYNCKFCAANCIWKRKVRYETPEKVVTHIEYVLKEFKVDALYFGDESFTMSKKRVYEIFKLLRKKKIMIIFGCQTRVNLLDEDLLKFMKKNGLLQIDLGIESGSQRMLDVMNKQIQVEQIIKIGKICRKLGVRVLANMLINVPTETLQDIKTSLALAKKLRYNIVLWNVYSPVPGVNFGKKLDLEDLHLMLQYPSRETFDLLERKYKFGNYMQDLNFLEDWLYSYTFHPKHFKFTLDPYYWYTIFLTFSYIFDLRYIMQLLRSKKKKEYLTNMLTQKTTI